MGIIGNSRQLSDYLHLYLGCECERTWYYASAPETVHSKMVVTVNGELIDHPLGTLSPNIATKFELRLLLRPLSSMTEKQKEWYGGRVTFDPMEFKWLLEEHFDLFGLIESGLAIDKTETPTT